MSIRGWVYVIDNQAMPGLVKVGYSTKDPTLRAKELAGTGTPHPFRVVFDALVEEPRDVEQAVHAILGKHREAKEWFRCSSSQAITAIRSAAKVLTERGDHSKESSAVILDERVVMGACPYYECGKPSVAVYKGVGYCDQHYREQRGQRFALARKRRDG
jgi:hypothetical protein